MNQAERAYWNWIGYSPEEYGRLCREESYERAMEYLGLARSKNDLVESSWIVLRDRH